MNTAELLKAFEQMAVIRRMEERISVLYRDGHIPGFVHSSVGQEGVAVGTLFHARSDDVITSTHRGHGHVLAKGLEPRRMLAELMGKETGSCRGRGGSMHVADPTIGIFGANGIVGAGMPIGVGAAYALKRAGDGRVAISFFGDGAVATGSFHESLNLAALWRLPMIFLCENNQFSEFSRSTDQHPVSLESRAAAFGVPFVKVPGEDVAQVARGLSEVLREVRTGSGPYLVEASTLRVRGHYEGDRQGYRDKEELDALSRTDPLLVARGQLLTAGVEQHVIDDAERRAADIVAEAEAFAWASAEPAAETVTDYLIASREHTVVAEVPTAADAPIKSTSKIIRQALHDALEDDPSVFLAGIDVGGGNVFGLTKGLRDSFGDRVLDTPIAETALVGLGVGSAMAGLRPVIEIMYLDFIGVCFDQIMNQAAKLRFMTGGAVTLPLVIRTQFGSGRSSGGQHSQSLEALLAHIPGLTVVMPSSGEDTYGLLRAAIEDDNPVIFIENRLLYESKSAVPHRDHRVPLGKARIARPGRDLTIVSWSRMLHHSLAAAEILAAEGIEAEVLDLRTIVPLDRDAILESLARTNRLVIAHEAVTDFGVGAEIAALAVREGFWSLDAPVARVGAPYSPAPYAPSLESNWIPGVDNIVTVAREVAQA
jgi:2-oxoisovalerate dehydrogenase E1 component